MNAKLTYVHVTDKKGFLATLFEAREHLMCHGCQAPIPAGTRFLRKRIRKPWKPMRYGAYCPTCEPWTEGAPTVEDEEQAALKEGKDHAS